MTDSTVARFLLAQQQRYGGIGLIPTYPAALDEEGQPSVLWGQGTPNGDLPPFNLVNKGSLYFSVNNADDSAAVYMKYDEGGDNSDWVAILAGINGGVLAEALEENARTHIVVLPTQVDISAVASEVVEFHAVAALTITEIGLIWEEATGPSEAVLGDITIGISTGSDEIVSAVNGAYAVSQAIGDYQGLTLTTGAMTAGQELFLSHDQADDTGKYRVQIKYYLNS
jgi:hypothetical protein